MELLDLPFDLLILLPQFLHNIEDFVNTCSSCRTLRTAFAKTSPNVILPLAATSSRVFFQPDPHFLIAATARQVSDWALLSHENTDTLRRAFQGGIEALFKLCISKAGLTLEDIRYSHASRLSLINPISDMIDRCAGAPWCAKSDFWNGDVSASNPISVERTRLLFQLIIYHELFCSSIRAVFELPRFDLDTRLDFIKYCILDWECWSSYNGLKGRNIGPYASGDNDIISRPDPDRVGLYHTLHCRTWREAWENVWPQIRPDAQPRSHPFYQNSKGEDGMWHCPFKVGTNCNHEPTVRKCGFEWVLLLTLL
jgi:hypothetical protein